MSLPDLNSSVSVACVACKFHDSDYVQMIILKTNVPAKTNEIVASLREKKKLILQWSFILNLESVQ